MELHDKVPDTLQRRALFWRARKAINLSEKNFTTPEAEHLRKVCLNIWDADTLEKAQKVCENIEKYCTTMSALSIAIETSKVAFDK